MTECTTYTLSEIVDLYFMLRGISKKKYYLRYMVLAQEVWRNTFMNTLWVVQSKWMPLKSGTPYNYVDVPDGCMRLLSVGAVDKCKLIQPLFYNNQLNVLVKPVRKSCGCPCEDCGGVCEDASSMTVTTKVMFTVNGVDYIQKCWIETCKNGDIIEFCETPVKRYNNLTGDGGDYNDDYNDDYDIADQPFSDYTIITRTTQKLICKVTVLECGCPAETEENSQILTDNCGCFLNWGTRHKRKHCQKYFENINNNHFGEIKMSDCNTKIYFRPSKHWKATGEDDKFPEHLLVNYQTDGTRIGQETLVPKYAADLMYAAIDYESKKINNAYSANDKWDAKYRYEDEKAAVLKFANPIDLIFMEKIQDAVVRY